MRAVAESGTAGLLAARMYGSDPSAKMDIASGAVIGTLKRITFLF